VHRLHAFLKAKKVKGFISLPGSYLPIKEGCRYDAIENAYVCPNEKLLYYHARVNDCSVCQLKKACCGNKRRQSLTFSVYRHYHQRMQERVESKEGKKMIGRRMSTIEPVFGSLLNYYGMKRSSAKGKQAAHKIMLMTATAYNLQKVLSCFPHPKSNVQILAISAGRYPLFCALYIVQQPGGIELTIYFLLNHNQNGQEGKIYFLRDKSYTNSSSCFFLYIRVNSYICEY
jgi:hypothetical protein